MPVRFLVSLVAMSSLIGCSIWPNQAHRALTLDSVQSIISQHCQPQSSNTQQFDAQRLQLTHIQEQLNMLTAATPGFTNANCETTVSTTELDGKTIMGANEWIYLSPPGHHYQARIDSGAATSSLSATDIEYFERNGKRWVRFLLQHDDEADAIPIEARVRRHVLIRQASNPEPERRPVITLTVNMGQDLRYDTEFTLTDRSQMTYPILMGREFLRDISLVDVSRQFIHPKYQPKDATTLMNKLKPMPTYSLAVDQP